MSRALTMSCSSETMLAVSAKSCEPGSVPDIANANIQRCHKWFYLQRIHCLLLRLEHVVDDPICLSRHLQVQSVSQLPWMLPGPSHVGIADQGVLFLAHGTWE